MASKVPSNTDIEMPEPEQEQEQEQELKEQMDTGSAKTEDPEATVAPSMRSPQAPSSSTKQKTKTPKAPPPTFYCDLCKVTLNAQCQFDQHLAGTKHKKKVAGQTQQPATATKRTSDGSVVNQSTPQITPSPAANTVPGGADPVSEAVVKNALGTLPKKRKVEINCDLCKVELTSEVHAKTHFEGKKHMKKVKEMEALAANPNDVKGSAFFCQFCNISLNSIGQVEAHRAGAKHRNAMTKSQNAAANPITGPKFNPNRRFQQPQNRKNPITCNVCTDRTFKSFHELQQHLVSDEHKDRVRARGGVGNFMGPKDDPYYDGAPNNGHQSRNYGQYPQYGNGGSGSYSSSYVSRQPPPPPPTFENPSYGY